MRRSPSEAPAEGPGGRAPGMVNQVGFLLSQTGMVVDLTEQALVDA